MRFYKSFCVTAALLSAVLMCAAGENTKVLGAEPERAAAESKYKTAAAQQDKDMMWIYDLDEGLLQVPYFPELPHHEYDWKKLTSKDGFMQYEDSRYETLTGIDVSKFQGRIDWEKAAGQDIDFAVIRLGYRGYGTGRIKLDERYQENVQGALAAGLVTGVYFVSQAVDVKEAVEEAEFVHKHISPYEIQGPVVLDTEKIKGSSGYRTENLTPEQLTDIVIAFCDRISGLGYQPMIYANAKWFTTRLELSRLTKYDIWYADYTGRPLYPYWFRMWQYSNKGRVEGISGDVDLNLYFLKKETEGR